MTNDVVSKQANKIKWTRFQKMPKEIKVCHRKKSQRKTRIRDCKHFWLAKALNFE